ncbi:MAG: rhodanese-like domain-containing protein [Phycisphaerales bacterium]
MKTIDAQEVDAIIERNDSWVLIDALPKESYERRHIAGAHSVPAESDDFVERVDALVGGRDDTVVLYCADHDCPLSEKGAKKLESAGFTDVRDFSGGLEEWERSGHALTTA